MPAEWDEMVGRLQAACWRLWGDSATYVPPAKAPTYTCRAIITYSVPDPSVEGRPDLEPPPTGPRAEVLRSDLPIDPERGGQIIIGATTWDILAVRDTGAGSWLLDVAEVAA